MAKASKIKALVKRGVVPYDRMGSVAATLIKQKEIRRLVGHRIQYLFVDEFQDVDTTQYAIFDELRKEKKATIFVVGDPEQYISTFTYGTPLCLSSTKSIDVSFFSDSRRSMAQFSKMTECFQRRCCPKTFFFLRTRPICGLSPSNMTSESFRRAV